MGRMWKQYGKDVETIWEGCGNNMIWKQYDQNFILPHLILCSFMLILIYFNELSHIIKHIVGLGIIAGLYCIIPQHVLVYRLDSVFYRRSKHLNQQLWNPMF